MDRLLGSIAAISVMAIASTVVCAQERPRLDESFLSIGVEDGPEEQVFSMIGDVARTADGRTLVLDRWGSTLRWYGSSAEYEGEVGGFGQGPGEFREPLAMSLHSGVVYVLDLGNTRVSTFEVTQSGLSYQGGFRLEVYGTDLCVARGRIFVLTPRSETLVSVFDMEGSRITSFGSPVRASEQVLPEFAGTPRSELSDGRIDCLDEVGVAFGSQFAGQVRLYDLEGGLRWSVDLEDFYPLDIRSTRGVGCCSFRANAESGTHEQIVSVAVGDRSIWIGMTIAADGSLETEYLSAVLRIADGAEMDRFSIDAGVTGFLAGRPYGYKLIPYSKALVY